MINIIDALTTVGMPDGQANLVGNTVGAAVTAAGNNLATATPLLKRVNLITTAAASTGVRLAPIPVGDYQIVQNLGANNCALYPPSAAGVINSAAAGGAVALAAATDQIALAIRVTDTQWIVLVGAGPAS